MIYIFAFGASWVKMGYTGRGPYERRQFGFWHNRHPPALCGRLDQCELVALFAGDEPTEKALHAALQPWTPLGATAAKAAAKAAAKRRPKRRSKRRSPGEFYPASRLESVLALLRCTLEPLPLPEDQGLAPKPPRKKPCCGVYHYGFERADHAARSFATKGKKGPCPVCGRLVSIRRDKLKLHQKSARCKPTAAPGRGGVP